MIRKYKDEDLDIIMKNIEGIFVNSNYHNKGIGTELLRKVMEQNRELSLRVYEKNKVAVNFYNKNLFKVIEKVIDESTGEYEYLMKWNLDNIN